MRGRYLFHVARPILSALSGALRILPRPFARALWSCIDGMHGRIAVGIRYVIARRLAQHVGDNVYFSPYVEIRNWENLRIGSNVSIHRSCYIEALGGVTIGSDVSIAHGTSIISFEHTWQDETCAIKDNPLQLQEVVIDDDVWIGCAVRILSGVHVRRRTIVAAGAVVTQSHEGHQVLAGIPAKPVKQLSVK